MVTRGGPDGVNHGTAPSLKKSPSLSTLQSTTVNGSGTSINGSFEGYNTVRRPERMLSAKTRPAVGVQRSHSRTQTQTQELNTVGEYALHHLFTSFITEADERIERCMPRPGEPEPRIENVCGPGADASFDQLISSLGHINRHKPNSLIDSVIFWRKEKANLANLMMADLQATRETLNSTQRTATNGLLTAPTSPPSGQNLISLEHDAAMAERKSSVSIYILCRVLIEIIGQTTLVALNGRDNVHNTASRLEDVIYGQVQTADPESLASSPLRKANFIIRGQLLGVMSGVRFEEVADRFIGDLEKAHKRLSIKGISDSKLASKTAMLVQSMRWLKVKSYPEEDWDHSCDMLQLLAKFFAEVHGRIMKHAYAELFEALLLPVAATATSELNIPKWKDVLAILQPRIAQMLSKADHWAYVFPLQAVVLCVSPAEQFNNQWLQSVTSFQLKARDRAGRSHGLKAICRLVWRYLYRINDQQDKIARKLDEVIKLVFSGGKRVLISTDPVIADPLIQLIRIIGYKHQDLCFRNIIFPLMNSEQLLVAEPQLKIENLDPEKTVIAIRAFLAIMADLEKGEPPPFPTRFECDALMDPSSRSPITHRRTKSQGFAVSAGRTERLSRPVMTNNLNDIAKEYYVKFCKILGNLTIICDNTFGGQAVLDEKLATTHTPKTPMAEAFSFNRREDLANPTDLRQHYYDLFHVAVEALPRCLSPQIQIHPLVNLLCTGTAHVESHIASSSVQSLKSIARQSYAQQVTIGFARFIFNFDDRYATVSDGSLLGPGHIENTLRLYVQLLEIWIEDIERRARRAPNDFVDEDSNSRQPALDLTQILPHVDEVESHGLFFLCSPSRVVRAIAVTVLRLITKFDTALGKPTTRIISILEGSSEEVININDERLSLAERSRLQKGLRKSNLHSTLIELCSSDIAHDANLWFKVFPNLVRLSSQTCFQAVALTRDLVCQRLWHSYKTIQALADSNKQFSSTTFEQAFASVKPGARFNSSSPDTIIEQWKIHLVFACTTLTNIGGSSVRVPKSDQNAQHTRKISKTTTKPEEKIVSATELFTRVCKFLSVSNVQIRNAAVAGLGATNVTLFHTLLESLQPYVAECNTEVKERLAAHQRNLAAPRRNRRIDTLRTEITHLLGLTCPLLKQQPDAEDTYALEYLIDYTKYTRLFLSDNEIQNELEFQKLRTHFCTLIEGLYDHTRNLKESTPWISFQSRQATFSLMENWCGFSPHETQIRRHEDHIRRSILEREHDLRNRGIINSAFEKEKNELQNAALSTMAALCAGPLSFKAYVGTIMQFDVRRMLSWVHSILETVSDRTHSLGRKALQNLIVHNLDEPYLLAQTMRMCYVAKLPKTVASYFEVVSRVLTESNNVTVPFWKILCAGLYTLGSEESSIRTKSVRLLRTLEERQGRTSKLQDLDISVSDKTTAVYKLAQFEISRRLANQHAELAFHVFSEFSAYFKELEPDHQRNMVSGMLPWIQTIELQLDPSGGPTPTSYMLLVNLFEITAKSSITLHNEIQALWQALATGPYGGNVQLVLDFIISICLDKKEQSFVHYARQIVVFLSKTHAGSRVVDYLLLQINPKTMVPERRDPMPLPSDTAGLPYIANLASIVPGGAKQSGLSLGQLCMMLLVDLVVSPFQLSVDKVAVLLQVILVQWDQYATIVQDQARELLVHLMHELVLSKLDAETPDSSKKCLEDFIEAVREHDPKIAWSYTDSDVRPGDEDNRAVSEPMAYVVDEVVKIFQSNDKYIDIREEWGKVSMNWATTCSVRHVACRSFQIFRCTCTKLDQQMLADMLARLSNTIADDENHDFLIFSLEILTTLRSIIGNLAPESLVLYPSLFWTTCACLDTIFEREYQEGLRMLDLLLSKLDLSNPDILDVLRNNQPPRWEGSFQGVHALLYKGMRSSQSMERSLAIMERLIKLPSSDIVGGDERLLFTVLANFPRYLHQFERGGVDSLALESAEVLGSAADAQKFANLSRALQGFAKSRYRNQKDFLSQCMNAIRAALPSTYEFDSLVFLLGMVNNQSDWFKVKTMQILCVMIPAMDMRRPEITSHGPDLISPLLRLLQTEHCQQALDVLDNVIDMTGTPMDPKHIRMSMVGSHSSRATRKEYERTQSLYGIPEESGWSVPMPALNSARTRGNVHAVFNTVALAGFHSDSEPASTPEFEFHKDEYQDSYFADRTATMMSDDTKVDGNMGELAMKLDSLDDFFDEQADTASPLDSPSMPKYPSGFEREAVYDQQALPILHKSLKRNTSVSSFQTGFAELRYQPPREPPVMNPMAFAKKVPTSVRPGLHNRSITSPVMTTKAAPHAQNDVASGDETPDDHGSFSDDELSIARAHTTDDAHPVQTTVKPAGFKLGFRQGLRRLTSSGGHRDAREALRSAPLKSPKVPKVPATFLRDPMSAEP